MNKKTKNTRMRVTLVALAIAIIVMAGLTLIFRNSHSAAAAQATNFDAYTNDDYFQFEGSLHSIRDYPVLSQPSRGSVGRQNSYFTFTLGSKDDVIDQIVPRQLFTYSNETLHIGDQYGFFISTTPMGNNFQSTVMVFDISTNNDLISDTLRDIVLEVEPIFQRKYAYLKAGSGSFTFQCEEISYYTFIETSRNITTKTFSYSNLSNDRIIPIPSRTEEVTHVGLWGDWSTAVTVVSHDNVDEFFLKDISFSASLSNVDELNHGDNGYDPGQDDGWFIIRFQSNLGGRYYVNNANVLDENVIYNNIYNTFKFVAGFTTLSSVIDVMDGIELVGDWFKVSDPSVTEHTFDNRKFEVTGFLNTRHEQIHGSNDPGGRQEGYKDADLNPMLIKTATLAINSDSTPNDVALWFNAKDSGTNNSAVARITVANGANGQVFSTNLKKEIAMSVVRAFDGQTVKTETSSYNSRLGYSKKGLVIENNVVTGYVSGQLGNAVEIPEGVTAIGNGALAGAMFFEIIIPNSVTSIGSSAFSGCTSLKTVNISRLSSSSVITLGSNAFNGCTNMTKIFVPDGASAATYKSAYNWSNYAGKIYSVSSTATLDPQNGEDNYTVTATYGEAMPDAGNPPTREGYTFGGYYTEQNGGGTQYYTSGMSSANPYDISGNTTLYAKWTADQYTITYRNSGGGAFGGTHGYGYPTTHTYGTATELKGATSSGSYTFKGWYTNIECSDTAITSLSATGYTSNITLYAKWAQTFVVENGVLVKYNGNGASIAIPYEVTSIGEYAFQNCNNLQNVTTHSGVTSIESYAFSGCVNLEKITISSNVTSIGDYAFAECRVAYGGYI